MVYVGRTYGGKFLLYVEFPAILGRCESACAWFAYGILCAPCSPYVKHHLASFTHSAQPFPALSWYPLYRCFPYSKIHPEIGEDYLA